MIMENEASKLKEVIDRSKANPKSVLVGNIWAGARLFWELEGRVIMY